MRRKTERSKTSSQSSPEKITRRSSRRGRKSPSKSPEPPQMEETIHEDDETEEPQNSSDSDSDSPIKSSKLSNKVKLDKRKRRQVEIEKENGDDKEKLGEERPVSLEEIKKVDKSVTPEPEPEVVFEAKDGNSTETKAQIGKKESSPAKEKRKPLSRSKETVKGRSRSSSSSTSSSSSSASSTKSRNRRVSRDHKSVTPDRLSTVEARRARSDSSPEKSHSPEARKIEPIEIGKMPENATILENSNQNVREGRSRSRRDSSADEKNIRDVSKDRARRSKSLTPGMRLIRRASTKSDDQSAKEIDPVLRKDSEISTPQEIIDDEMKENLPEEAVHIDKREAREFKNSISIESDKNDAKSQPTVRKRKWLSRKNSEHKPPILAISTDSLKNLISDVKPVPLSDVKLESSPEINRDEPMMVHAPAPHAKESRSSKSGSGNNTSKENNRQRKSSIEEVELDKSSGLKDESAPGQSISKNRKVSVMSEESLSPPKHELSNILYITNLVRPFTVLQLKGLLARTGKIVENGFWIDKIKSRCYVKYENEDEATETRHALHGVRWPTSNPKCLHVDFGTEIGFQKALDTTAEETQKLTDGRGGKMEKDFGWDKDIKDPYEKDKEAMVKPVREWDVGKKETGLDRTRDRDRERERSKERMRHDRKKRSPEREYPRDRERKRSHSASPARKFKKKENEPPLRLLDDLFRKTKATPCIYWLPLTAEQIAVKEEIRKKHMAEHQRRNEEIRKQEEEKDREREKDREKKRERDKEREREREKDREKNRDRSNDRRRDRSRSKERDGDRRRYR